METGTLTKEQERGMTAEQKAALEKATKERQAAMAKNKELNDAFNAGMEGLKTKQYDAAIQAFTKAGELDPKQHVIWGNLAEVYSEIVEDEDGRREGCRARQGVRELQEGDRTRSNRRKLLQQLRFSSRSRRQDP